MASVWRAHDRFTKRDVALKLLRPDAALRRSHRSRFIAEAQTMASLGHPNVLQVYEIGEDKDYVWFSMEIVEGGALIDALQRSGRIPAMQALHWLFQVLQALAAAHDRGVVHRDVKPDNILIRRDGSIALGDFGIARIRDVEFTHRTRPGIAMGTAGYMAPEQREDARSVGPPADIYAVGATLYASITGLEPPDLFAAHLDPRLLRRVPPVVRDVILRACNYMAEARFPDARAMAVAVAHAHDALARGTGTPEQFDSWMAHFDTCRFASAARPRGRVRMTAATEVQEDPLADPFSIEGAQVSSEPVAEVPRKEFILLAIAGAVIAWAMLQALLLA